MSKVHYKECHYCGKRGVVRNKSTGKEKCRYCKRIIRFSW